MDHLSAMRAFVRIVDSGSYTKAAQQLDMHKATLSQRIRQLENRLGARLLVRTTRSVAPTPEGRAYHQHACSILLQVEEAESSVRRGSSSPAGHLRVNVPVAMGRLVFAPEIRGFLQRYPRVSVELGCSDRAVDLVREGIDCALRGGALPDSGLSARPLGALRFVLCAAPGYLEAHGAPDRPDELPHHHQIGFIQASNSRVRAIRLLSTAGEIEHDVPARFVTTDSAAALSAALDGLGLIVVAEFVASQHLSSGALVRVLPEWRCPSLPLHLVTPDARKRATRVQVFMDWAQALLARRLGPLLEAAG